MENTDGNLLFARGDATDALQRWQQAEAYYRQADSGAGVVGSQINQGRALQALGLLHRAEKHYEDVCKDAETKEPSLVALCFHNFGNVLVRTGNLDRAQQILDRALILAQQAGDDRSIGAIWLSLGNVARAHTQSARALGDRNRAEQEAQVAIKAYQQALGTKSDRITQIQAQINFASLLLENNRLAEATQMIERVQLETLPANAEIILMSVQAARLALNLKARQFPIVPTLETAARQAQILGDRRTRSLALGTLGEVYEHQAMWQRAEAVTQQALLLAQEIDAADILYQWQWQLGRIARTRADEALPYYRAAYETLRSLRDDLTVLDLDVRYAFRDRVEPVYREYVELILSNPQHSQTQLQLARQAIEDLQLAELDNFLREACLKVVKRDIDKIDAKAAVIYPILLRDRLAVIASFPTTGSGAATLSYHEVKLARAEIEATLDQMRQSLNPIFPDQRRLQISQQLYDWLVRPFTQELTAGGIQTLVFVPDGALRNLPMAALHDGKRYLIETYGVAMTPGLQLLPAKSLSARSAKLLAAGLTEEHQGFAALPAVRAELEGIHTSLPGRILFDREFTEKSVKSQLSGEEFSILHLASHGSFSSNPEQTFVLSWEGKIGISQLTDLLRGRNAIELLVMSACQTAEGDNRAALGLAGIAMRSGARSTLATLWTVDDRSTANLMVEFYKELSSLKVSRAKALQQAQISLLQNPDYIHPYYWAPFVLVGNWL
jgi:CHAT domain-containing protein